VKLFPFDQDEGTRDEVMIPTIRAMRRMSSVRTSRGNVYLFAFVLDPTFWIRPFFLQMLSLSSTKLNQTEQAGCII